MRIQSIILICLVWAMQLRADTLTLRSGRKVEGKIVSQSRFQVRIRTEKGVKSVAKSNIRRIIFGPVKTAAEKAEQAKKSEAERKKAAEARRRLERKRARERQRRARARYRRALSRNDAALWRSAVFPGWGQYYLGANEKAGYFAGGALATGVLWFLSDRNFNEALQAFDQNSNLALLSSGNATVALLSHLAARDARTEAEIQGSRAQVLALLYLGIYVYNLWDVRAARPKRSRLTRRAGGEIAVGLLPDRNARTAASRSAKPNKRLVFSFTTGF